MKQQKALPIFFIAICVIIIIFLMINFFTDNRRKEDSADSVLKEFPAEKISYKEAIRMFSFLTAERAEREEMDEVSLYSDAKDEYVNAAILTGLLKNAAAAKEQLKPMENLTCGQFRDLIFAAVDIFSFSYEEVKKALPERFSTVKEEDLVLLSEFLPVYEKLAGMVKEGRIKEKQLYFLGKDEKERLAAQDGTKYFCTETKNYSALFGKETDRKKGISVIKPGDYIDSYETALVCGDEIIYLKENLTGPVVLHNVYLLSGADHSITLFLADYTKEYETAAKLSTAFTDKVGDITMENGKITGITLKPDMIHGKVLLAGKNQIEVEGYGSLMLHPDFHIYKVYDELAMETANAILVGYSVTDFVVSNGQICAALIKEKIKAQNIRVVLHTSNQTSLYHKTVTVISDSDFVIDNGDKKTVIPAGEKISVGRNSNLLSKGRIKITPLKEEGFLTLLSVNRSYGNPHYRGSLEITEAAQGLIVVNELSIEEYLYSVVPSEMPVSYGSEALKVQAVCARSYALKQLYANKYSAYGAHVDDSVNCQVYNNVEENEPSIQAVKETYGQVLMADGEIITAFYFSTSCGVTANVEEIWEHSKPVPFLSSVLQTKEETSPDLSSETAFRGFINDVNLSTYDSGYLMYRWKVNFDVNELSSLINHRLSSLYKKRPSDLLTSIGAADTVAAINDDSVKVADSMVFASKPVSSIGTLKQIKVTKRGECGVIQEMVLVGSKASILVRYQSNVRSLFAPGDTPVIRLDESVIEGMSLLPSAFCYFDPVMEGNKVTGFTVTGGGFGHGVGMSQNGVKSMCREGKTFEEVLAHYYPGSSLGIVY